jgi:hypothetical protein
MSLDIAKYMLNHLEIFIGRCMHILTESIHGITEIRLGKSKILKGANNLVMYHQCRENQVKQQMAFWKTLEWQMACNQACWCQQEDQSYEIEKDHQKNVEPELLKSSSKDQGF